MLKRSLIVIALVLTTQSVWAQDNPTSKPAKTPKPEKAKPEKAKAKKAIVFEKMSPKTRGLATLKEILALFHHNKMSELCGRIADGKGKSYSIPMVSRMEEEWSTPEKAAAFKKKNFPRYDDLYRAFDGMKISKECTTKRAKVYWDGVKKISTGTVYTYHVEFPGKTKKFPRYFSRLQFLEVNGKIYLIPFGW